MRASSVTSCSAQRLLNERLDNRQNVQAFKVMELRKRLRCGGYGTANLHECSR